MKIYICYHSEDVDGWLSAFITYNYCKLNYTHTIEFVPWSYGDKIPVFHPKSKIYLVDIVFQPFDVLTNIGKNNELIIIDHHKSSIEEIEPNASKYNIAESVLDSKNGSACNLCWKYFFPNQRIPFLVKVASNYDAWIDPESEFFKEYCLPFSYMTRKTNYDPISKEGFKNLNNLWNMFEGFSENIDSDIAKVNTFLESGKAIKEFVNLEAIKSFNSNGTVLTTENGLKVLANFGVKGSDSFPMYDEKIHDIMMAILPKFENNSVVYNVSFYSTKDDIDVSEIAKQFGGGGHKGASGASRLKEIPFVS